MKALADLVNRMLGSPRDQVGADQERIVACLAAVVVATTLIAHWSTLALSPMVARDEVEIVDYGRRLLDPTTEWGLSLDTNGRPAQSLFPVYLLLQRAWLALFGVTPIPVRTLSALCGVAAVAAFFLLLRLQGVGEKIAALSSLGLWFDPLFVTSLRMGRADTFAMMLALLACGAWSRALSQNSGSLAALSGLLAGVSLAAWPTAAITLAFGILIYGTWVLGNRQLQVRCVAAAVGAFAVVSFLVASYYIVWRGEDIVDALRVIRTATERRDPTTGDPVTVIIRSYLRSPWVVIWVVLASVVGTRNRRGLQAIGGMLLALGVATCIPPFYPFRLLYVVPLFYLVISRAFVGRRAVVAMLLLLVVPSAAVNVGARTVVAVLDREYRDYVRFGESLERLVPANCWVVGDWSIYYVGLRNGWKMFNADEAERWWRGLGELDRVFFVLGDRARISVWQAEFDCVYIGSAHAGNSEKRLHLRRGYTVYVFSGLRRRRAGEGPVTGAMSVDWLWRGEGGEAGTGFSESAAATDSCRAPWR